MTIGQPRAAMDRWARQRRAALAALAAALASGCGGRQGPGAEEPSATETSAAEETAPAEETTEEATTEETTAVAPFLTDAGPVATEPDAGPCRVPPEALAGTPQLEAFRRWLHDQSVGRHLAVEAVDPLCGDRRGLVVIRVTLRGASGELLSLGRALGAYYPGATWRPLGHDRLPGPGLVLRLRTEVSLPVGALPRPRCTWDPSVDCR